MLSNLNKLRKYYKKRLFGLKWEDTETEKRELLMRYRKLLQACKPNIRRSDRKLIRQAFDLALEAHRDMRRKSGEPYIYHPVEVARIVAEEIGLSTTSIICALLHDVVEDTDITLEDIQHEFDEKVAQIIEGLTKLSKFYHQGESIQAENFRKILLTLAEDVRVILIKVADRLHNMRTLEAMPERKQLKIASETLYLYAPLAHRLGLYTIKSELEDLAMKYLEPEPYHDIRNKLKEGEKERSQYIREFINPLKRTLYKQGVKAKVYGRSKSIYSIWNKMKKKGIDFEEVYDIFAIRVIVETPPEKEKSDCWRVYSVVTDFYRPNPDRLRDWISMPKANGYEALHTTVMGPEGKWVEVQIRSERMDEIAEKGIAAHWKYKADEDATDSSLEEWLRKIREVLENPDQKSTEFLDNIKLNLFSEEIYVFTPRGDLRIMPHEATVLDFAFDIHTDIGYKCIGAKVNHKLVSLNHRIENGDQVEIITSNVQKPSEEWLNYVVTAKGTSKVKDALNKEKRNIARKGKRALKKRFREHGVTFNKHNVNQLVQLYLVDSDRDLYYNIATRQLTIDVPNNFRIVKGKLKRRKQQQKQTQQELDSAIKTTLLKNANLLQFGEAASKIDYEMADCCNPIPGDEVVAIYKENGQEMSDNGQGLDIHKKNCKQAVELMSKYGNRIVQTKWTQRREIAFLTAVRVIGLDDVGIMYRISKVISAELKLNMQSIHIEGKEGKFEGTLIIYVHDTEELERVIERLEQVKGITEVKKLETA